jgi:tetratricopeptide (TPR) repeat protein
MPSAQVNQAADTLASNQVIALYQSGRFAELEQLTSRLLVTEPQSGFLWKAYGVALQMQYKDATTAFVHACELEPEDMEACANLGNALYDAGHPDEAEVQYQRALTFVPDKPEWLLNLGNAQHALGHDKEASATLLHALAIQPSYAQALYSLGLALSDLGETKAAIQAYRQALDIEPAFAQAQNNLGLLLEASGLVEEAKKNFNAAFTACPDYADAWYNLGRLLAGEGDSNRAITCYQHAVIALPDHADAWNNLGDDHLNAGRLTEAARAYDIAISIRPGFVAAHYSLSLLKIYHLDDPHCAMLENEVKQVDEMSITLRIQFWFALGKMYEDLHRYDASFTAYREANQLKASQVQWNEQAEIALFHRAKAVFDASYFATHPPSNLHDATPIFIVGMPRSGTSLIEQILASYPNVYGAGELSTISEVVTRHMSDANYANFPEAMRQLSQEQLDQMGQDYLKSIRTLAPDAERIVDKMPINFYYLGLIRQILPNAKIIHAMREPMDSCFSCYSRLFANDNQAFSYDLETLGRYYLRYADIMRHWRAVLPPGTILDLHYEDMVADTEGQARRMLDYLGLPWNPACLDFHRNARHVKTASMAQVIQPIYKSSVARWQRYAQYLTPLQTMIAQNDRI